MVMMTGWLHNLGRKNPSGQPWGPFFKNSTNLVPNIQLPKEIAEVQKYRCIRTHNHLIGDTHKGTERHTESYSCIDKGTQRYT